MASYSSLFGNGYAGGLQKPKSTTPGLTAVDDEQTVRQAPAAPAPKPTQTFAQMQAAGQARPAPPPPAQPPVQQAGQQAAATGMGTMMPPQEMPRTRTPATGGMPGQPMAPQAPVQPMTQAPSPEGQLSLQQQAFNAMRQSSQADLQAQFQAQQQQLNEEMARRGLSASTIGAGRMGDLAGQQARALAGLDAQLLQQQAQQAFEAQQAAEQRAFAGGESALERALRQQMQTAGFGQEADMLRRQQEFAGGESELDRMLRERMQTGAQTFEAGQAEAQRRFAGGESALERALRERLQTQQMGESAADRALRERLAEADITGRYGGQETMAARQFASQQEMQRNQMLTQLAGLMAGGSPEMLQMVLGRFGLGGSTTPTTTATPTGPIGSIPSGPPAPMPTAAPTPMPSPMTGGGMPSPLDIPLGTGTQTVMSPAMYQQVAQMFNPYSAYNPYSYGVM